MRHLVNTIYDPFTPYQLVEKGEEDMTLSNKDARPIFSKERFELNLQELLDEFYEDFYEYRKAQHYPMDNIRPSLDFFRGWLRDGKEFKEDWRERKL